MSKRLTRYYELATIMAIAWVIAPADTFAQVIPGGNSLGNLFNRAVDFLNRAIPVIITIMVVLYFFRLLQVFLFSKDAPSGEEKREVILSGLIPILVAVALWGIIAILLNTFGVGAGGNTPPLPRPPTL